MASDPTLVLTEPPSVPFCGHRSGISRSPTANSPGRITRWSLRLPLALSGVGCRGGASLPHLLRRLGAGVTAALYLNPPGRTPRGIFALTRLMEPKRRGRPPGVRNGQGRTSKPIIAPPHSPTPLGDGKRAMSAYRHADPQSMVSRQLTLINVAQEHVSNELEALAESYTISDELIEKLLKLSSALDRAVGALTRSSKLAEELASRMTPRQLLEAAIDKIEGQDEPTLTYAIRRLRAARSKITTRQFAEAEAADTAVGALAALGADLETLPQGAFPETDEV